jgi:hypothetical protein
MVLTILNTCVLVSVLSVLCSIAVRGSFCDFYSVQYV